MSENQVMDLGIQPENPFLSTLVKQGFDFNIREQFKNLPLKEGKGGLQIQKDQLTGLVLENGIARQLVARELGKSVRKGTSGFFCLYTDVDNLKHANTSHGRQFGDLLILNTAASVTQTLAELNLPKSVNIYVLRSTHAADEIIVWGFNLSAEQLEELEKKAGEIEAVKKSTEPLFNFSSTHALIRSNDLNWDDELEENYYKTKTWLKEDETRVPFELLQMIEEKADTITKQIKINKDINNLDIKTLIDTGGLNKLVKILENDFGNKRISDSVLELICKIVSIQTVRALANSPKTRENFNEFLTEIGVGEERLSQAKTAEDILSIFKDLFGELPTN